MKIARLGEFGKEKPAVIVSDSEAVFIDDVISDWNRTELENGALDKVKKLDLASRPKVKFSDFRLGSPVARPTKAICIGLNYTQHAHETGAAIPQEPIIFMKAPDTVIGGNDTIIIPPNSVKTDYEVEICVVIGKRALYLKSPEEARDYILGFTISQDVSERYWQVERGGQWVKGKSFPTFNPVGPWIITTDEMKNEQNLRLWCEVDGEMRQDSNTSDMIFNIAHCVWYLSQVMELMPGDIINTGTPQGVGMGFKPEKFLKGGETVRTGIDGIGVLTSQVIKHS
jgi:2-keto-4-pentenoate hydratase/2-oxohepta-3-ene-1,7-dioic acid hydratase in catechol pathway